MLPLETAWFLLVGVLLAGYAILDGFDLGVGMLHLFVAKSDSERRQVINSVGPVWDGNEVWLLTGGGALFAAFPKVYATVFSGLYLALTLVLAALILRAVSLEFRSKLASPRWRSAWDTIFAVSSFLPSLLFGVAVGNILRGLPLDPEQEFAGTFLGLLNPFALVVGAFSVSMFLTLGAAWLDLKTEGPVRERARAWARVAWLCFVVLWLVATLSSRLAIPRLWQAYAHPLAWVAPALFVIAAVEFRVLVGGRRPGLAFACFSVAIAMLLATMGQGLYPDLVPARGIGESLTVMNASSTPLTLGVMLAIALIGMPFVIGYTIFIYRRFKGPVKLDEHSY
jgi:cytochrome bd ubiquinol oxidase subunit II